MREEMAQLEESVSRLIQRFSEARKESDALRLRLAEQQTREERIRKELEYWKAEAQGKAMGEVLEEQGKKKELRVQLDQLIAEIDRVLAKIQQ